MNNLTKYDEARNALAKCATIDEAKLLITQSEMMIVYAKQMGDIDMEIWIAEIKLRAKRKFGEISKKIKKKPANQHTSALCDTEQSKSEKLASVGVSRKDAALCEKLSEIDKDEFEEVFIKAKEEKKPVTFASVEKTVTANKKKHERKTEIQKQVNDIELSELPVINRKYHVISIDPPWPYEQGNKNTYDSDGRRVANPYPEMSIEAISDLEIPAQDDCVMWLWTTHKFLPDSFELLKKWGFEYKATMVWDKQKIGMGHWLRMQCEFCLLAVKGDPLWDNTTVRDIMSVSRREHSRKPDEFFNMVDEMCHGSKLEYFSREKREGWEQIGNDKDKFS